MNGYLGDFGYIMFGRKCHLCYSLALELCGAHLVWKPWGSEHGSFLLRACDFLSICGNKDQYKQNGENCVMVGWSVRGGFLFLKLLASVAIFHPKHNFGGEKKKVFKRLLAPLELPISYQGNWTSLLFQGGWGSWQPAEGSKTPQVAPQRLGPARLQEQKG